MSIEALSEARLNYLKRRVRAASDTIPNSLDRLKQTYITGMSLIWSAEGDVGPDEVLEMLGTDASQLFIKGNRLLTFIMEEDPDWIPPLPTREFTINPDGSVTLAPVPQPTPEPDPEP